MLVTIVAGARPNFMKIAPIIRAISNAKNTGINIGFRLVHTGQHFDQKMSGDFFEQLHIPKPDVNLECGGGSQAEQTAAIMVKFERELQNNRPDIVLVVGDVTSTMACTITARKLGIDTAHVEAGIRSGDWSMPEEINRVVTDSISNYFFTTSATANENLLANSVPRHAIYFVGNTMIDTLFQNLGRIKKPCFWDEYKLQEKQYFLTTLHRPSNVDDPDKLASILQAIHENSDDLPAIFPVHPRTRQVLTRLKFSDSKFIMVDPLGYLEFIYLVKHTRAIITDSGGITEEATMLGVPCLTLRDSTERPETVTIGTNELIGDDYTKLGNCLKRIMEGKWKTGTVPPLWDGKTSERIVDALISIYDCKRIGLKAIEKVA